MKALVVFHGFSTHWLRHWLKKGFGHVFVALVADGAWVTIDGRAGRTVVELVAPADYDLAAFYRDKGFTVVETEQGGRVPLTPFVPYNCVGVVRAILALDAPWVITPWQLYKYLMRRKQDDSLTAGRSVGCVSDADSSGRVRRGPWATW